jgi:putative phosphoribosyl transferase
LTPKRERSVRIPGGDGVLVDGDVVLPPAAKGIVVFAHGSGSSRRSPRNQQVAEALQQHGLATLLMDLLTADEEQVDLRTRHLRFDVDLLAGRLVHAFDWLDTQPDTHELPIGCFGASTGAAAGLGAAPDRSDRVGAVVSRGGRPDLAGAALPRVHAPTLLIVGSLDHVVVDLNRQAAAEMTAPRRIEIVPGATHLFEESGALERVAELAISWFLDHLAN